MGQTLTLKGIGLELKPGEDWSDPIALNLTREEAVCVLAVMVHELENCREGLEAATNAALKGNRDALLAALALTESEKLLQATLIKITGQAMPDLVSEAMDELKADVRKKLNLDDEGTGAAN